MRRRSAAERRPRANQFYWDDEIIIIPDLEVHGRTLQEPIGFLRFPHHYAPPRKPRQRRKAEKKS